MIELVPSNLEPSLTNFDVFLIFRFLRMTPGSKFISLSSLNKIHQNSHTLLLPNLIPNWSFRLTTLANGVDLMTRASIKAIDS